MTKFRLNHTLLFTLIAAFLTMQWTAAHIHLAEDHDHGGGQHQHSIDAHSHQLAGHHADSIDSSHQNGDVNVVEIDPKYNTTNEKIKTLSTVAITSVFQQIALFQKISTPPPVVFNTKLSHLYRSTVNLRAPPRFS